MENKSRVLIVEKEGIIAKDLERVLEKLNYNVLDIVYSGQEAIQKAEEYKPDLVITEIALNGPIDGIDVAHQLSSRFNIPVVFLTAVSDNATIERAKIAEPYGFIIKPFEEDLLHATIEMALYKHGMQTNKLEKYMTDSKPVNLGSADLMRPNPPSPGKNRVPRTSGRAESYGTPSSRWHGRCTPRR